LCADPVRLELVSDITLVLYQAVVGYVREMSIQVGPGAIRMSRPVVNPGVVSWAGEHLLLYLRPLGAAQNMTTVSFYRTQYSPVGAGHAALVRSDVRADGPRAIFTDNPPLADWCRQNLARGNPRSPFRDSSVPVVPARFESSGAVGWTRVETIHASEHEIVLTWTDFEPPLYFEGPRGTLGADYDVFSLLFPAATASVSVDGVAAQGRPYPNEIWRPSTGRDLSSALIAICEVLIDRASS
jgi:hypothetical protein